MAENTAYPTADHVAAGSEPADVEETEGTDDEATDEATDDENTEQVPGA